MPHMVQVVLPAVPLTQPAKHHEHSISRSSLLGCPGLVEVVHLAAVCALGSAVRSLWPTGLKPTKQRVEHTNAAGHRGRL